MLLTLHNPGFDCEDLLREKTHYLLALFSFEPEPGFFQVYLL